MKFFKYSLLFLLAVMLIGCAGYLLAASGIKSKPGYAKLTTPNSSLADTKFALNLGPKGVAPFRWVIGHIVNATDNKLEDSEKLLLNALQDVQGLQLRVYEINNNRSDIERAIDDSVRTLKRDNWQAILVVREHDKRIVVMQIGDENLIEGLSVLASTPENAVFANLVGPLDPESIVLLAQSLN